MHGRHDGRRLKMTQDDKKLRAFTRESLSGQVQQALKAEILDGALRPEQRIDVNFYSDSWNISPTPIRDALKQLEVDGFVEISPRRGAFVAKLDRTALREIFELRIAIECIAIRLATPHIPADVAGETLQLYRQAEAATDETERNRLLPQIDELIHNLGIDYCGNRRLKRYWESTQDLIRWSRMTIIRNLNEPYATTLPEHIGICEAVVARDAAQASEAMRDHLEKTFERADAYLASQARLG